VSERILSQRELNRALLARQLLLEPARLTVARAVERVAGLQAQEAAPPFIGLWTRLEGFERSQLTRALARRTVVKATLMRGTLHLVSARDYAFLAPATLPMIQSLWRRYLRDREPVEDVDSLAATAIEFAREPRTTAEMREALGGEDAWWRVRRHALFVHAPGDEPWGFPRRVRVVAAASWVDRPLADEATARRRLVRRYLAAFGPAGVGDVAAWSGLTAAELRPVLERLRLRRFRDERGRELFDLPGAALPDARTPAPPRLLPAFDNTILSHADRTRILPERYRRTVIRGGLVDPVVLVDGFVAGRWQLVGGRVELEPFEPLPRPAERALQREAEALASFTG
jgi:hypothetical protein